MTNFDILIDECNKRGINVDINFMTGITKVGRKTFKSIDAALEFVRQFKG